MKHVNIIIIPIITLCFLFFVALNRISNKQNNGIERTDSLKLEHLFVNVNSDTVAHYLNKYAETSNAKSLKIKIESNNLMISYNQNAPILLDRHDNNLVLENKLFNNTIKDGMRIIRLEIFKKDGVGYVKCPAPILVEILRTKENSSEIIE